MGSCMSIPGGHAGVGVVSLGGAPWPYPLLFLSSGNFLGWVGS